MSSEDPRLRIRLYVGGDHLVDEVWIDASNPDATAQSERVSVRHRQVTDAADTRGEKWLIEVFDPDAPPEYAYKRFGTDQAGMVQPRVADRSDFSEGF